MLKQNDCICPYCKQRVKFTTEDWAACYDCDLDFDYDDNNNLTLMYFYLRIKDKNFDIDIDPIKCNVEISTWDGHHRVLHCSFTLNTQWSLQTLKDKINTYLIYV